jgi:hypothetical protein
MLRKTIQPDKDPINFSSPNSIDKSFEKLRMRTYVKLFKEPKSQKKLVNLIKKEEMITNAWLIF